MKVWILVILHSYMIPEHFYTSQTLLCSFRTLLYDPEHFHTIPSQAKTFIPVIPFLTKKDG